MRRLVYLSSATRDLLDILTHLTESSGSVSVATGFIDQLRGRCLELASLPGHLGRPRPELRPDIRSLAHKGYVIFFRYDGAILEIVAIIEGHRDIPSLIHDEAP